MLALKLTLLLLVLPVQNMSNIIVGRLKENNLRLPGWNDAS
jgi:hypothetical protein